MSSFKQLLELTEEKAKGKILTLLCEQRISLLPGFSQNILEKTQNWKKTFLVKTF